MVYSGTLHYLEFDGSRINDLTKRILKSKNKDAIKLALSMSESVLVECQDLYLRHICKDSDMHMSCMTHYGHGICTVSGEFPTNIAE